MILKLDWVYGLRSAQYFGGSRFVAAHVAPADTQCNPRRIICIMVFFVPVTIIMVCLIFYRFYTGRFVDFAARFGGRLPSLRAISTILKTSSQRRSLASSCGDESAGVATTTPSRFFVEYASATSARTDASSSGSMAMRCRRASTPGGKGSVHAQGSLSLQLGQC